MKNKIIVILLASFLTLSAVSSLAASKNILKLDEPHKLDVVDQNQDKIESYDFLSQEFQFAQSFKPSLPKLTKIYLYLFRFGLDGSTITVSIRENLDGPDLVSKSISSNDINPEKQWVWVEFDFNDLKVKTDSTYYIVVVSNDDDIYDYVGWGCHCGNPYPRGNAYWRFQTSDWEEDLNKDYCFQTYGTKTRVRDINNIFVRFPFLYQLFQKLFFIFERFFEIV